MAYKMDFFGGTYEKVTAAIASGKVKYPAYVLIRDEGIADKFRIGFVDKGNVLKLALDENDKQVVKLTQLPDTAEASTDVIYLVNNVAYIFDGEEFQPLSTDYSTEIEAIQNEQTAMSEKIKKLEENTTTFVELE